MLIYKKKKIKIDKEGYLKNVFLWNEEIAEIIAEKEGIILSFEHWEIIRFVRNFYIEFNISPNFRIIVKAITDKWGQKKGNTFYLYKLFPGGLIKQTTKIAGLPKPTNCI